MLLKTEYGRTRIHNMGQRQVEAMTEFQEKTEKLEKLRAVQSKGEIGDGGVVPELPAVVPLLKILTYLKVSQLFSNQYPVMSQES